MSDFPNRPDSDDFKLLSKIITEMLSKDSMTFLPDELNNLNIDPKSVLYMGSQRILALVNHMKTQVTPDLYVEMGRPQFSALLTTMYIEAFLMGAHYIDEREGGE